MLIGKASHGTHEFYETRAEITKGIIGFTTRTGTVTAASNRDEPAQRKRVRASLPVDEADLPETYPSAL